jgi:hypothetical protein
MWRLQFGGRTQVFYNLEPDRSVVSLPSLSASMFSYPNGPFFEQELHVILLNFARNSVREVFLVHFLDFLLKSTLKGSFPENNF